MLLKIISAGLLLTFCAATKLRYPDTNPCILIDVEANNSLSWKHENDTSAAPNWNFDDSHIIGGNCSEEFFSYLDVLWPIDNGTMRFNFHNSSNKVMVEMSLSFVPEKVFGGFNNTDNSTVIISVPMEAGSVGNAYKCNAEDDLKGSSASKEYDMTLRLKNLMIQGFGVENGSYSKADECSKDVTTVSPNSTTEAPNTTVTVSPITTTVAPKTAPKVYLNATDGNRTCAMVVGEMTLIIPYSDNNNKSLQASVFVTKDVHTNGTCNGTTNTLLAMFHDGDFEMLLVFGTDNSKIWWDMLNVTVVYDNVTFPMINDRDKFTTKTFQTNFNKAFQTSKDGSYLCNADTTTDLSGNLKLKTTNFQYTAFQNNVTTFSDKNVADCDVKTSSIVPIAVGAALAGLVVIVLIAYLIGRRRNRKGYESV